MNDSQKQLETAEDTAQIQSADDLAIAALSQQSAGVQMAGITGDDSEEMQSDKLATTLNHLQNIIERNANELNRISGELKEMRESMKNVFENDQELAAAEQEAELITAAVKQRRSALQTNPQVTTIKAKISDLNEQKKEIEETISNHLVNYFALTNSKSFDTSDGDQWEFDIKARVKARKK